ncbi:MAG: hypothetical protein PHD15_06310 [Clostridia bacterium]|nr:hypothetical protein [Clostridia bacterium]MDD4387343.1 hypothetical protein [Clostridia bacterium]
MIKEFKNVKIGCIEYDYISIDTENTSVDKTYIIKNKHKYEWQTTGTNEFGTWDSFLNKQNGKEYNTRVYNKDIITFLKGDIK